VPREAPGAALLLPPHRLIPQHLSQPEPLRLPPVQDRFHNVGRQTGERQEPADGVMISLPQLKSGADRTPIYCNSLSSTLASLRSARVEAVDRRFTCGLWFAGEGARHRAERGQQQHVSAIARPEQVVAHRDGHAAPRPIEGALSTHDGFCRPVSASLLTWGARILARFQGGRAHPDWTGAPSRSLCSNLQSAPVPDRGG